MRLSARTKILIVFFVLLAGWLFVRIIRWLIPLVVIAIVVGFIWDWTDNRGRDNKYRE